MKEHSEHFILRWLKNLTIFTTCVISVIAIVDWLSRPKDDLQALVRYSPYAPLPGTEDVFAGVDAELEAEDFERVFLNTVAGADLQRDLIESAALCASLLVRGSLSEPRLKLLLEPRGLIHVDLKNNGKRTLEDIKVSIPLQVSYSVSRAGIPTKFAESAAPIEIGDLSPLESVQIVCWSHYPLTSSSAHEVAVVHREGLANLSVLHPVGHRSIGYVIDRLVGSFGWGFFLVVFTYVLLSVMFLGYSLVAALRDVKDGVRGKGRSVSH